MATTASGIIYNILAKDLEATARFYEAVAGLERVVINEWSIGLRGPNGLVIGVLDEMKEYVPGAARGMAAGGYLTILVPDARAAFARARELDVEITDNLRDMPYGQTRFVCRDPNYVTVEITTPTDQLR